MINTIIFDLDGTLINLNIDFIKLKSEVQALLKMKEPPTPFLEKIIEHSSENLSLRNMIWNVIDRVEEESISKVHIFPETIQVINELKEKGYNLSLVTMQGRKIVHKILKKFSLFKLFNPKITREDSHLRNLQIELVIKNLKLSKNQIIMIGDRINDVNSSKKAGVKCILIRRRYNPLKGTIVIKSLSEIFQYISKM